MIDIEQVRELEQAYHYYWNVLYKIQEQWKYLHECLPDDADVKKRLDIATGQYLQEVASCTYYMEHFFRQEEYFTLHDVVYDPDFIYEYARRNRAWFRVYWRQLAPKDGVTSLRDGEEYLMIADQPQV